MLSSSDEDQSLEEFEQQQEQAMRNSKLSFISCRSNAENELSTNSDDLYITANESSFSSTNGSSKMSTVAASEKRNKFTTRSLTIRRRNEPVMSGRSENAHQQHENSTNEDQLLRGKKKRASTSSCSSSDSYVSYGSGYASGSSHSTDLEQRKRAAGVEVKTEQNALDEDTQLEKHLSELEQLTDDLAKRNILADENYSDKKDKVESKESSNLSSNSAPRAPATTFNKIGITKAISNFYKNVQSTNDAGSRSSSTSSNQTINSQSASHVARQSPTRTSSSQQNTSKSPIDKTQAEPFYHNLFQWEQLVSKGVTRPLLINDLDFTDLHDEDDCELLNSTKISGRNEPLTIDVQSAASQSGGDASGSPKKGGVPATAPPPMPPPPISPWFNTISSSRPQSQFMSSLSPPPPPQAHSQESGELNETSDSTQSNNRYDSLYSPQTSTPTRDNAPHPGPTTPSSFSTLQPITSLRAASSMSSLLFGGGDKFGNKRKKTMKLFWKEVREDRSLLSKLTRKRTIWDEIKPVHVDTQRLEHLFESKAKDLLLSKSRNGLDVLAQRKIKITVLDAKRSNAINIGMTKLPPMRTIKSAILKMDSSIMNREGIEKILTTMMPSEEEKSRIIEAQLANPDTPLGTAEQFLLNLASISALEARLKLWAFQLDYAQIEKEVAEPLMDLKQAIEEIERSETFRNILGTLLAIGNFLNSTNAKGFQIDYLEKVPEVKDTVHKHSLLHHLCLFMQEKYDPELAHDLYSEFSAVNRASKVDYAEVAKSLKKMQQDCKSSWDYLKIVAKHDGLANLMNTSTNSDVSNTASSVNPVGADANLKSPIKISGKLSHLNENPEVDVCGTGSATISDQLPVLNCPKQLKARISEFLTDCGERIIMLDVIHRRVMNRFQKMLFYLGCPSHQIKQTHPQQILKIISEFALEYRTKSDRLRSVVSKKSHHQLNTESFSNRSHSNRNRWNDSNHSVTNKDPNKTTSSEHANSFRPSFITSSCAGSICDISIGSGCDSHLHSNDRASSPSGFSQTSNYSDCVSKNLSHLQLQTPARAEHVARISCLGNNHLSQLKQNSLSVSMYDLQNQQHPYGPGNHLSVGSQSYTESKQKHNDVVDQGCNFDSEQRQKDEQMRRLLGADKSLDESCNKLFQMSHWSTTMTRVTRNPPSHHTPNANKSKGVSFEEQLGNDNQCQLDTKHQSPYFKYDQQHGCLVNTGKARENSDDEILQSLVKTATAKINHHYLAGKHDKSPNKLSSKLTSSPGSSKEARSNLLSRINCNRQSMRRTFDGTTKHQIGLSS